MGTHVTSGAAEAQSTQPGREPTNGASAGNHAGADLAALHAKLDALTEQVAFLVERQRWQQELIEEMTPIAKVVVRNATSQLADLEAKGWFGFGRGALSLVQRVVEHYGTDDIEELGESIVTILDTVRAVTQPEVLEAATEATEAIQRGDELKPVGVVGMVKASQDDDVQRGLAVMFEALRSVGKTVRGVRSARSRRDGRGSAKGRRVSKLEARLGPSRKRTEKAGPVPACQVPGAVGRPGKAVQMPDIGVAFTPDGYLADPAQWNRDVAAAIAKALGVDDLSETHWKVIDFARADFLETGVSPNIRRLTTGSGVSTRELYALFPSAPGKATARVAGIAKPAGCI